MNPKAHWEQVYQRTLPHEVSWYQRHAQLSMDLIRRVCPALDTPIIDVGGGASTLVDDLLEAGYGDLTVLDLSPAALAAARNRLGVRAAMIRWIESDLLEASLPRADYGLWHDRAVFHFLTQPSDRARYLARLRKAVPPGGLVLIATFADDGPTRCSGLPAVRYAPETLQGELGASFRLVESEREEHLTPGGVRQSFIYCLWRIREEEPTDPIFC
jgi:SAM-dependent methyltransferase